jgi:hypothetical protein
VPPLEQVEPVLRHFVLIPGLLAVAIMVVACVLSRWHEAACQVGCVVAIAAGIVYASNTGDTRLRWVPEAAGGHWLLWTVLAALAVDAVARVPGVPTGVGWGLRGMVSAQAGWLLTPVSLREELAWAPVALGSAVLAEWAVLEQLGRLDRRGLIALALTPVAAVASLVSLYAAEIGLCNIALVLMAALGGVGMVALAFGRETNGVAAAVAVLLPGPLLLGQNEGLSELPITCFGAAAFAPLALAPSLLPVWQRYQKRGLFVLHLVLLLLPLAWAIYLAAQTGPLEF